MQSSVQRCGHVIKEKEDYKMCLHVKFLLFLRRKADFKLALNVKL